MKLTEAQITALDTAGAFEEPIDDADELLGAALATPGRLETDDPEAIARIIDELSNAADVRGSGVYGNGKGGADPNVELRAAYRKDCQVFMRLSKRLRKVETAQQCKP